MEGFPHMVVARREYDFRVVDTSTHFPYGEAVQAEARWLALDWWGSCYVKTFQGAIGHFCSRVEHGLFFLMLVQPGPVAPDRFLVCLKDTEYSQFSYNPFWAVRAGIFDFAGSFYTSRREGTFHIDWKSGIEAKRIAAVPDNQQQGFSLAQEYLARGTSIIVHTHDGGGKLMLEFRTFLETLASDTRRRVGICTFTNSSRDRLEHFGPLICGWYDTARNETLIEVLQGLVPLDDNGSPFRTIRRPEL